MFYYVVPVGVRIKIIIIIHVPLVNTNMDFMNNYGHDALDYRIGIICINTDYCGVLFMTQIKSVINV